MISIIEHRAAGVSWRGDADNLDTLDGKDIGRVEAVPLHDALTRTYDTDAHFACYHVMGAAITPRLAKASEPTLLNQGQRLMFNVVAVDFDDPWAHKNEGEASDAWRTDWHDKLWDIPWDCDEGMSWYDTRGGGRAVWQLAEPIEGGDRFEAFVWGLLCELRRRGLDPDMHCKDWTRLYRLPHVVRGEHGPQEYEIGLASGGALSFIPPKPSIFAGIETRNQGGRKLPAIFEVDRNVMLTAYAGQVVKAGYDDWQDRVRVAGETRCVPPLPSREVEGIIRSASRWELGGAPAVAGPRNAVGSYKPPPPLEPPPPVTLEPTYHVMPDASEDIDWRPGEEVTLERGTDTELAGMVDLHFGGDHDVIGDLGQLWRYHAPIGLWRPISEHDIARHLAAMDGWPIQNGLNSDGMPKFKPLMVGENIARNTIAFLRRTRGQPGWLGNGPVGCSFTNGFASFEGGELEMLPPDPENRATMGLPFDFETGLQPARFLEALALCFDDGAEVAGRIQLIREFVGVALLGKATTLQRMLLFHGDGNNGKSVILDVITGLFPRNTVTAIAPTQLDHEYNRARLAESRINIVGELPDTTIVTSDKFKQMISGDKTTGRNVTERPFDFYPVAAWLLSLNELPHVNDMTDGFWRRVMMIDFGKPIPAGKRVRGLASIILRAEAREIACWAIEGGTAALARGEYHEPEASDAAVQEWKDAADQVGQFMREHCKVDGGETKAATVYARYKVFAKGGHLGILSVTKFGRRLKKLGVDKKRKGDGFWYQISLSR